MFFSIDTRVNKQLSKISDDLYNTIKESLPSHNPSKARMAIQCITYNCLRFSRYDENMYISLNKNTYKGKIIINGSSIDRKVSYRLLIKVLDTLEKFEYITLSKLDQMNYYQFISYRKEVDSGIVDPMSSTLDFSNKFMSLVRGLEYTREDSVIELRDKDKKPIPFRKTSEVREKIELLNELNEVYRMAEITTEDGKSQSVEAMKIYNCDWMRGGRTYYKSGSIQVLSQIARANLAIDGSLTSEIDINFIHPAIVATLEGHTFKVGFSPYDIPNPYGVDPEGFRALTKVMLLVAINANSAIQCIKAIEEDLEENSEDFNISLGDVDLWEMLRNIKKHNPYLKGWINSGRGGELQNYDSKIADRVVGTMLVRGIVILVIHDSFITKEEHEDELIEVIFEAFEYVLGNNDNCGVSKK